MKDIIKIKTEQKFLEFLLLNNDQEAVMEMCLSENFIVPENKKEVYKCCLENAKLEVENNNHFPLMESEDIAIQKLKSSIEANLAQTQMAYTMIKEKDIGSKSQLLSIEKRLEEIKNKLSSGEPGGFRVFLGVIWTGIKVALAIFALVMGGYGLIALGGLMGSAGIAALGASIVMVAIPIAALGFWIALIMMIKKAIKMKENGTLNEKTKKQLELEINQEKTKLVKVISASKK